MVTLRFNSKRLLQTYYPTNIIILQVLQAYALTSEPPGKPPQTSSRTSLVMPHFIPFFLSDVHMTPVFFIHCMSFSLFLTLSLIISSKKVHVNFARLVPGGGHIVHTLNT